MFLRRLRILELAFLAIVCVALARLADLQLLRRDAWLDRAPDEFRRVELPALRGRLVDRDGRVLARDRQGYEIRVVPSRFRRHSLLLACRDLLVALGDETAPIELILRIADDPPGLARRTLDIAAAACRLDRSALRERLERLRTPGGELVEWAHPQPDARLRELLGVLRGDGRGFSRADLRRLREDPRRLGEVLRVGADDLSGRLETELASLAGVAREIGEDGLDRLLFRLESLLEEERRWVEEHVEREFQEAVCLHHLGTARISPRTLGPVRYLELVRAYAPPLRSAPLGAVWLEAVSGILGGALPVAAAGADSDALEPPASDALSRAREEGGLELDRRQVTAAYCRGVGADERRDRYLPPYRERRIRRRLVGARGWRLGRGARPWVLEAVVGPGTLAGLGFSLEPIFVRDELEALDGAGVALLLGGVNTRGEPLAGLELRLDGRLAGAPGHVLLDRAGKALEVQAPRHGESLALTLDLDLQRRLQGILDVPGAIAVIDVETGGVLGLASWPAPEAAELAAALEERLELENLRRTVPAGSTERTEILGRLASSAAFHRAVELPLHSPPGSIFKPLTLLVGLEAGVVDGDTVFDCPPPRGRRRYGCRGHGPLDVVETIERSCNHFCYETGRRLGVDGLVEGMERLAWFDALPGLLPEARRQRRLVSRDPDFRSLSIGQASLDCPPVRAAGLMASFAAGRVVRPHLLRPDGFQPIGGPIGSEANVALIREGLARVVLPSGTASGAPALRRLRVAGKTGTADFKELGLNQAWFAGYAPRERPRVAFAVMIERTLQKGGDAARLTADVLAACAEVLGTW